LNELLGSNPQYCSDPLSHTLRRLREQHSNMDRLNHKLKTWTGKPVGASQFLSGKLMAIG